jgi:hypothetical protein
MEKAFSVAIWSRYSREKSFDVSQSKATILPP